MLNNLTNVSHTAVRTFFTLVLPGADGFRHNTTGGLSENAEQLTVPGIILIGFVVLGVIACMCWKKHDRDAAAAAPQRVPTADDWPLYAVNGVHPPAPAVPPAPKLNDQLKEIGLSAHFI